MARGAAFDPRAPLRLATPVSSGLRSNLSTRPNIPPEETVMLLIREIFYCKPGKVRPMIDKFKAMSSLMEKSGAKGMRLLTDLSGEQYWTLVAEMEVPNLQALEDMMSGKGESEENLKQYEKIMEGYHDLIVRGRREVYKIEG
jgi:hypothetical protein